MSHAESPALEVAPMGSTAASEVAPMGEASVLRSPGGSVVPTGPPEVPNAVPVAPPSESHRERSRSPRRMELPSPMTPIGVTGVADWRTDLQRTNQEQLQELQGIASNLKDVLKELQEEDQSVPNVRTTMAKLDEAIGGMTQLMESHQYQQSLVTLATGALGSITHEVRELCAMQKKHFDLMAWDLLTPQREGKNATSTRNLIKSIQEIVGRVAGSADRVDKMVREALEQQKLSATAVERRLDAMIAQNAEHAERLIGALQLLQRPVPIKASPATPTMPAPPMPTPVMPAPVAGGMETPMTPARKEPKQVPMGGVPAFPFPLPGAKASGADAPGGSSLGASMAPPASAAVAADVRVVEKAPPLTRSSGSQPTFLVEGMATFHSAAITKDLQR